MILSRLKVKIDEQSHGLGIQKNILLKKILRDQVIAFIATIWVKEYRQHKKHSLYLVYNLAKTRY